MRKTSLNKLVLALLLLPSLLASEPVVLTFAGDTTLGEDPRFKGKTFSWQWDQVKYYRYFTEKLCHIFEEDDLTIVNLEGTLTKSNKPAEKKYRFKADPHFVNVLKHGSIEAVTFNNNHFYDYGNKGLVDTKATLKEAGIDCVGVNDPMIFFIKGKKIVVAAFRQWERDVQDKIIDQMLMARQAKADLTIATFHWGEERKYTSNSTQRILGRFAIRAGADIVIGHHPHVVQEIERYQHGVIVYSLGNFIFGGNRNPDDKKAILYQVTLEDKGFYGRAIPINISSVDHRNNYQPMVAE